MALNLDYLTIGLRCFMLEEAQSDITARILYFGNHLTSLGKADYPHLLKQAIASHDDKWLGFQLQDKGRVHATRPNGTPGAGLEPDGFTGESALLEPGAGFAECEFHRFYLRALCCYAQRMGVMSLRVECPDETLDHAPHRRGSDSACSTFVPVSLLLVSLRAGPGVPACLTSAQVLSKDQYCRLIYKLP